MPKFNFRMVAEAARIEDDGSETVIARSAPYDYFGLGYDNLVVVEGAYVAGISEMGRRLVNAGFAEAESKVGVPGSLDPIYRAVSVP